MDKTNPKEWANYLVEAEKLLKDKGYEFNWDDVCVIIRNGADEPVVILDYHNRPTIILEPGEENIVPLTSEDGWNQVLYYKESPNAI